jgi:threonine dehydrogenase-like Zn-dependent dehydrogenase
MLLKAAKLRQLGARAEIIYTFNAEQNHPMLAGNEALGYAVKREWPRLFEHVRKGYLKPSDVVTHRIFAGTHRRGLPHLLREAR